MAADYFDRLASELVGGAQERYVAALAERCASLLARSVANPDAYRQLARTSPVGAMRLWAEWEPRVTAGCRAAWEEAVSDEDEAIVAYLSRWTGDRPHETAYASRVAAEAARGMSEVLRRENVALAANLEREWAGAVADAVARVESGDSPRRVLADATARLASLGLETIDYRTGARCRVDAALRRHVVTQANQARNDLLMRRMDEWGVDLVFVSAHYGARPSHAVWQGRVFSRSGSSPKYPLLVESTGYGTAGGLCGVNCRHTMTPYVEGLSRLPDTDFAAQQRLTGMTSDEYYAATQAQRRMEAAVRATKREVAIGEAAGADVTAARVRLGGLQGRLRDHCRANHLRRDYERERAYGLPGGTAQPRALRSLPLEQRERFIPREQMAAGTAYDVKRKAVNGRSYRMKFDDAGLPKRAAATCYTEARRILRDRDGTDGERMSVVSWRDGRLVCDTFGSRAQRAQAGLTLKQYERAASTDGGVVIVHNHPASTRPSWADLKSVAANEFVRASLVLCHDGTVYVVSGTSPQLIAAYEGILDKLRDQLGGTVPDELVKMRALDEVYERNEDERWLRIRRL